MLYRMVLCALALMGLVMGQRDDPDNNEPPSGECKDRCGAGRCNKWAVDDHPCSSGEFGGGIAIDPWRCGEPRCQETTCDQCGDRDLCVSKCEAHKARLANELGMMNYEGYPNCNSVCSEGDLDYMCYEDTCNPELDILKKPQCYSYWKCSEAYCSARGRQECYAKENYFDPWGDTAGDPCKITQCRRCGPNSKCLDYCNDWNDRKANEDKVNCKTECAAVKGWACYFTPAPKGEEAAKFVIDFGDKAIESSSKRNSKFDFDYKYPVGFGVFASLAVGAYLYRRHTAKYSTIK